MWKKIENIVVTLAHERADPPQRETRRQSSPKKKTKKKRKRRTRVQLVSSARGPYGNSRKESLRQII